MDELTAIIFISTYSCDGEESAHTSSALSCKRVKIATLTILRALVGEIVGRDVGCCEGLLVGLAIG
jgi:hypothetical protein